MAISKLNLEDFCNEVFSLFAIHTDLDDYRLAYFLNKHLGINLFRKAFDLDFVNENQVGMKYSCQQGMVY